jgi:hypothetical protein
MRVAICQPTYLPWIGYFDLMDQVDTFVLLDTVQFEKQSWQQRNRIKTPTGLQWLTVPIAFRGRFGQKICEVKIRDGNFGRMHLRAIELNYSRGRFFRDFFPDISAILGSIGPGDRLVELNVRLLELFVKVLGIRTPMVLASSLNETGKKTLLLANICRKLGATQYVSPIGSAEYLLAELVVMNEAKIETLFHNYIHPQYEQRFPPFVPFASAIDLIINEGDRSMEIIRSGRHNLLTPDQVSARIAEVNKA